MGRASSRPTLRCALASGDRRGGDRATASIGAGRCSGAGRPGGPESAGCDRPAQAPVVRQPRSAVADRRRVGNGALPQGPVRIHHRREISRWTGAGGSGGVRRCAAARGLRYRDRCAARVSTAFTRCADCSAFGSRLRRTHRRRRAGDDSRVAGIRRHGFETLTPNHHLCSLPSAADCTAASP